MTKISTPFKFITIIFASAFLFVIQQALSYAGGPPTGLTGAPSEGNCTSCHSGTAVTNSSAITIRTNMTNGQYIPDSTYQIRITGLKTGCVKFGFSTTMLNASATPSKLGSLQLPTGANRIALSTGTRDYISHNSSGTSALYTDSTDWVMNWKAPATLAGDAKLYVVLNATNNSTTSSGDIIHLQNFTIPQTTNVPAATITSSTTAICQGDSVFFQGSATNNPLSYQWTFPGGSPATSTAQSLWVKFTSSGNKVCSLRVANNIINSPYTTKSIQVNASPSSGITYNSAAVLCEGDSIQLSNIFNSASYSFQWQLNGNNISGAISFAYFAKLSGSYRLIVSGSNGCTVITSPVTLSFNAKPNATLTSPSGNTSCAGDSINLKAVSGVGLSYYWYKNNILQVQSTDSNYFAKTSGSYYVKVFTSIGCNASSNAINLNFYNKPSGSIASQTDSICAGDSVSMIASNTDTIVSYQWFKDNNLISGATQNEYYAKASGSYTVSLVSNRGCSSTFLAKQIKVNAAPANNFIDSVKTGCIYTLKVRNTGNYSYKWIRDGSLINVTDTQITASQTGVYSLVVSNASGCSITTNSLSLNIPNAPNVNITPVSNAVICSDSSATYQVPAASGATFKWYKNGVLIGAATQNSITVSDSGNFHVVVDNGVCAVASAMRNVKLNTSPIAIVTTSDTTYCTGDSTQLSTNNLSGLTYQWYLNNAPLANTNNSVYFAKAAGSYKVKISLGTCSKTSNSINITEKLLPAVPTITRNVDLLTSSSASSYQWFKNGLPISGATNQSHTVTGNGNYTVQVAGANGCKNTSTPTFVIPTGIASSVMEGNIDVYPNPVYQNLNLNFGAHKLHLIVVFDAAGRVLSTKAETDSKAVIDFSAMESGIYFVKVASDNSSQIIRIVKK